MNDPQPKTRGVDAEAALKPCPFCGGNRTYIGCVPNTSGNQKYVRCIACGTHGPTKNGPDENAIAAWNRRPADAPPTLPDVAERCRKMEDALREVSHACHSNACVTGDLFLDPDVLRDIDALICPAPQAAKAKGQGE